jgi:hypothetical protein
MSAGHTPGPWTYESDHTHRQFNIRMLGREAQHICTVNNLPPHILANRDQSTAEANARLIAAAPDLLAALKCIATAEYFDGDSIVCDFETLQGVARAAIAKAEAVA